MYGARQVGKCLRPLVFGGCLDQVASGGWELCLQATLMGTGLVARFASFSFFPFFCFLAAFVSCFRTRCVYAFQNVVIFTADVLLDSAPSGDGAYGHCHIVTLPPKLDK